MDDLNEQPPGTLQPEAQRKQGSLEALLQNNKLPEVCLDLTIVLSEYSYFFQKLYATVALVQDYKYVPCDKKIFVRWYDALKKRVSDLQKRIAEDISVNTESSNSPGTLEAELNHEFNSRFTSIIGSLNLPLMMASLDNEADALHDPKRSQLLATEIIRLHAEAANLMDLGPLGLFKTAVQNKPKLSQPELSQEEGTVDFSRLQSQLDGLIRLFLTSGVEITLDGKPVNLQQYQRQERKNGIETPEWPLSEESHEARLLENLLLNAKLHGSGQIEIEVDKDKQTIVIRNPMPAGSDFDPETWWREEIVKGTSSVDYQSGNKPTNKGLGLGLPVARAHAAAIGAELDIPIPQKRDDTYIFEAIIRFPQTQPEEVWDLDRWFDDEKSYETYETLKGIYIYLL